MGVREKDAALSEAIDVRRPRIGVTTKDAAPIIEIIDDDEEHIGVGPTGRDRHNTNPRNNEHRNQECHQVG